MKNLFLFMVAFIIGAKSASVNAQCIKEGDNIISFGYGFGVIDAIAGGGDFSNDGNYNDVSFTGPLYFKYEHALSYRMTIGINVAYGYYKYTDNENYYSSFPFYAYTDTYETFSFLTRLNWHFGHIDRFDPYWGFGFGYRTQTETSNNDPYAGNYTVAGTNFPVGFEITIGARYYVTDQVAFYMETGLAKSVVQVGMSFKLNK